MAAITFQPMPTTAVGIASTVAYGVASTAAFTIDPDYTGTVGLSTNAAGLGILSIHEKVGYEVEDLGLANNILVVSLINK